MTKNGITRLSAPPTIDKAKMKTDKKIVDEEILKILEQPVSKSSGSKNKSKKKKKPMKKPAAEEDAGDDDDDSSEEE